MAFLMYIKKDEELLRPSVFDPALTSFDEEYEHEGQGEQAKKRLKRLLKDKKISNPIILKEKRVMVGVDRIVMKEGRSITHPDLIDDEVDILASIFMQQ